VTQTLRPRACRSSPEKRASCTRGGLSTSPWCPHGASPSRSHRGPTDTAEGRSDQAPEGVLSAEGDAHSHAVQAIFTGPASGLPSQGLIDLVGKHISDCPLIPHPRVRVRSIVEDARIVLVTYVQALKKASLPHVLFTVAAASCPAHLHFLWDAPSAARGRYSGSLGTHLVRGLLTSKR
jgi:hypothetical protein